jgi:anti-anti-sigma factor
LAIGGQERPAAGSGTPAVVVLPAEIDFNNAEQTGRELADALDSGAGVVIADGSATTFCDSPGARMLLQAQDLAAEKQIDLRLVLTSSAVLRVLQVMELDGLLRIYPSLAAAAAGR